MGVVTEARDIRKLSRKLFAHLPQSVRLWVNQCDSSQRMKSLLVTSDFSKMLNFFVMNGNAKNAMYYFIPTLASRGLS